MPDMVKIYPTLVLPGSELYNEWLKGNYKPIDEERGTKYKCEKLQKFLPPFVRINRVQKGFTVKLNICRYKKRRLKRIC